jgi:hypothetical protein
VNPDVQAWLEPWRGPAFPIRIAPGPLEWFLRAPEPHPEAEVKLAEEIGCRDEDGQVVARIVRTGSWCPHGRPFRVAR